MAKIKTPVIVWCIVAVLLWSGAYFIRWMPDSLDNRSEETTLFSVGEYEKFLEKTKRNKDPNSLYRQGIAAVKLWNFDLAQEKLFQNLVFERNGVTAALLKSLTLYNKDDPNWALAVLSNIKTKNLVEKSSIQLMNWVYLVESREFAKAENMLIWSQRADPSAPATSYYLWVAQNWLKKWQKSIDQIEKAKNLWYQWPEYERVVAQGYFAMKQWEEARVAYEALIKSWDHQLETFSRLGLILTQLWDVDETIKIYQWVISKFPDDTLSHFKLAAVLIEKWSYEEATSVYDNLEGLIEKEELVKLWIDKLWLYYKQGLDQEKNDLYNKIVLNIGNDVGLWVQLADKLMTVGMSTQAKSYIDTAMVKTPKNRKVRTLYRNYLIRDLLYEISEWRDTDSSTEQLLTVFPWDDSVKKFVILAYEELGDQWAALRLMQEIEWDAENQYVELMNIFLRLYEAQIDIASNGISTLDTDSVGIVKITLLQWYVAAVRWNEEVQNNLIDSLWSRIPWLNKDLINDVFAKEFKDRTSKFDPYYDTSLLDMLP